jgi:hypothetical protein
MSHFGRELHSSSTAQADRQFVSVSTVYKPDFRSVLGMISKFQFLCTALNSFTWTVVGTALGGKHLFPMVGVHFVGISTPG